MISRLSAIFVLFSWLIFPNICHPVVYFAGWVQSDDDIDDNEFPDEERSIPASSHFKKHKKISYSDTSYLPETIKPSGEKVVIVDPHVHAWGAYSANGKLLRSGLATAGSNWCSDIGRSCRTKTGTFRIYSLGNSDCVSSKYPIEEGGGAPMPYCMYFNGSQGLHGSNGVVAGNISHGCVRLRVNDAEWLRYQFVSIGTKVIVLPY